MLIKGETGQEIPYGTKQFKELLNESWRKGLSAEEFFQIIEADSEKWLEGLSLEMVMGWLKEKEKEIKDAEL